MMQLPRTPDGWLDDSLALDDPEGEVLSQGVTSAAGSRGILAAANEVRSPTSGLTLLMEPQEIASVPGLPQHVYESLPSTSPGPGAVVPASYVISRPGSSDAETRADKFERGATGTEFLGHAKDGWNAGNQVVDKVLKSGRAEKLRLIAEKSDYVLAPIANGLGAAAEIAKGAPVGTTVAGYMLGPNKQKIGESAQRVLKNAGQSYSRGVLNNPYYDPRLAAMP